MRFSEYSRRVRKHGFYGVTQGFLAEETLSSDDSEYPLASSHHIHYAIWDFLLAFGPRPLLPNLHLVYHNERALRTDLDWRRTPYHSAELLFGPKLRKIAIVWTSEPYGDPEHITTLIRSLSSVATTLEELSLEVVPDVHDFLPRAKLLYGTDIRFFQGLTTFSSRSALCVEISNLPAACSVTDLFINVLDSRHIPSRRATYWSEDVSPLFTLPAIQRLSITGGCTTILDDLALEVISRTWLELVELVMGYTTHPRPDDERILEFDDFPYATPWGLLQLARDCPRMTKLALALDLRFYPISRADPGFQFTPLDPPVHLSGPEIPGLLDLDTTGSLLGDPMCIASFLSLSFPQLRVMRNDSESEGWWDVYNHWLHCSARCLRTYALLRRSSTTVLILAK
ncbi:hypothetical protein TRAPUB_2776 [Trametes pubescens]|uniref:F-box domain-containing protein n=1 Tax=Trametes pubescens TaxID=154538 RepID=A0A1M2VFK8_TRAPU|nr:hypothetical protein TRAPUB_2776 [Trametes pubescens]